MGIDEGKKRIVTGGGSFAESEQQKASHHVCLIDETLEHNRVDGHILEGIEGPELEYKTLVTMHGHAFGMTDSFGKEEINFEPNQDRIAYATTLNATTLVVADGFGSEGEHASQDVMEGILGQPDDVASGINQAVHDHVDSWNGDGTCIVATSIERDGDEFVLDVWWAGDCKLYAIPLEESAEMITTTEDNVASKEYRKALAALNREKLDADTHRKRNEELVRKMYQDEFSESDAQVPGMKKKCMLTNAVIKGGRLHHRRIRLQPGTILVLGSDCLNENYTDEQVEHFVRSRMSAEMDVHSLGKDMTKMLFDRARNRVPRDAINTSTSDSPPDIAGRPKLDNAALFVMQLQLNPKLEVIVHQDKERQVRTLQNEVEQLHERHTQLLSLKHCLDDVVDAVAREHADKIAEIRALQRKQKATRKQPPVSAADQSPDDARVTSKHPETQLTEEEQRRARKAYKYIVKRTAPDFYPNDPNRLDIFKQAGRLKTSGDVAALEALAERIRTDADMGSIPEEVREQLRMRKRHYQLKNDELERAIRKARFHDIDLMRFIRNGEFDEKAFRDAVQRGIDQALES